MPLTQLLYFTKEIVCRVWSDWQLCRVDGKVLRLFRGGWINCLAVQLGGAENCDETRRIHFARSNSISSPAITKFSIFRSHLSRVFSLRAL